MSKMSKRERDGDGRTDESQAAAEILRRWGGYGSESDKEILEQFHQRVDARDEELRRQQEDGGGRGR